mgnify:CR=1 FL=1
MTDSTRDSSTNDPAPIRTLVIGSCVARDTFAHFPDDQYALVEYVARQSLVSAFSPPVTLLEPPTMASRFQQRMVRWDYNSQLPNVLAKCAGAVDLVLWDLTDERLGFYVLPDDTVVTRTVDLIAAEADRPVDEAGIFIEFGSDAHFEMWSDAARQFVEAVTEHHPTARLQLLALPWAEFTETREPTPTSFGLSATEANQLLERYYEFAETLPEVALAGQESTATASSTHRWGIAPFHYATAVLQELSSRT